jgi:hypothetical protein
MSFDSYQINKRLEAIKSLDDYYTQIMDLNKMSLVLFLDEFKES